MPYHLSDHFPEALHAAAHFGWMGVDLFFVLSGFLIASQMIEPFLQGRSLDVPAFYARRAYRILPAFYVVLLLYVFVPVWREAPGLQTWWQFATFTENLVIDYRLNQAFSHAWSLCVEEHFYLLLPLLTILLMRRPAAWKTYALLTGVLLFGVAVRAYVLFHILRPLGPDADFFPVTCIEKLYYPTYVRLDGLLAGVSLALLRGFRPHLWKRLERHGHALTIAGVTLIGLEGWCSIMRFRAVTGWAVVHDLVGYPVLGLGFGLLVASALSTHGVLARVRVPGARLLATLAFGMYLTHKEAVHLIFKLLPGLPDGTYRVQPLLFAVCLGTAAILYVTVERPFLRLRTAKAGRTTRPALLDLEARVDPAL